MTNVLLAATHNPAILAKQASEQAHEESKR